MLLSYIDENITLSLEALLMKKSPCKWKRDCRKYCVYVAAELMKNLCESWRGIDKKTLCKL